MAEAPDLCITILLPVSLLFSVLSSQNQIHRDRAGADGHDQTE